MRNKTPIPTGPAKLSPAPKLGEVAKTKPMKPSGRNPIGNLGDFAHPAKKGKKK